MGVYRFEDLRVWQAAKIQSDAIGDLINRPCFFRDTQLAGQMNSASISVMNNIAEGFLRGGDKELLQFLRIAAASNGEARSCLYTAVGRNYLPKEEADLLIERTNAIGRMLRRFQQAVAERLRRQRPGTN